jgi:hypothetical protein
MTQLGPENWARLALWFAIGLNVYFVYGYVRNEPDLLERTRMQRRALIVFTLVMAGLAAFMLLGDTWLDAPALHVSDLAPGESLPEHVPTLWEKWVGFPAGLAHGMAIFLGVCAAWNLVGLVRLQPKPTA